MAKKFDSTAFHPEIADDLPSEKKIKLLCDALGRVYSELRYQLSSLGAENFNSQGMASFASALGVPRLWSSFEPGEVIAPGTLVIYGGRIWKAKRETEAFSGAIYEGDDFELAS